ncbi:MAG: cupin domain-containing protein [Verrucomicrobiota bacterium]
MKLEMRQKLARESFAAKIRKVGQLLRLAKSFPRRSNLMPNYMIAQLDETPAVRCPCGFARRAFASPDNSVATLHLVDIQEDSQTHYHKQMTELYLVLEGEGEMELDGKLFPLKPMTAVLIKPGCRHRAIGKLKIVNIPIPAFDSADEWFDE